MDKVISARAMRCKHVALAVTAAFLPSGQSYALPTGEAVVAGDVTVARPTTQTMQINQATQKGIVNWTGFSIGASEHVNITQPNSSASLLNRVLGNNPSEIFGRLTANGQVFLVNNAGVLFAPGASVSAASIVASTLSITDQNFLNGNYQFYNPGNAGSVVNQGSIVTAGGYTALIGPQVRNDGIIIANSGKVAIGAGDRVSLDMIGDGLVSISVDQAAFNASVVNTGTIQADGGTVLLKASSTNALLNTVLNTSGIVRANALVERNGEIVLDGGGSGMVQVAGTVQAGGSIDITAGGALNVGSTVCCIATQITAGSETITAGSITIGGGATVNTSSGAGSQTITTPGTLLVRGGILTGDAGFFHNASGEQRVTAGNVEVRGGSGTNTGAFISSTAGADQTITVTGELRITGGGSGTGNRAGIVSNGNQTITGNPNIVLTGGAGGVAGSASNNVFIQATGGETKPQTINAATIQLTAGAGFDGSATLNAARQIIATTGNVSLFGGSGPGGSNGVRIGGIGGTTLGPTNLTLSVGGNLLLHGGTVNSANLGSSGASTQANNITVTAQSGNVTLQSDGGGARIGANAAANPVNPGNITVTAGGNLSVGSGTGIRANGPITLTANSLTNDGTISNGGGASNMILLANAFDLAGSNIQGGSAGVFLRPRDGARALAIEAAGDPAFTTTLTNADIAAISTSNFIGFGSGMGTNFTGDITVGQNALVNAGAKNLVFFRSSDPTARLGTITIGTHGVASTGDVIVSAGRGSIVSGGGTVAGDEVQLRASQGIGTSDKRINTAATALTMGTSGDAFVTEANDVTLRTIVLNVGGNTVLNTTNTSTGGMLDLTVGGALNVTGPVTSTGSMNINAAGALNVTGAGAQDGILSSSGGQTITAQSVSVTAQDGRLGQIVNNVSGGQTITTGALSVSGGSALTSPTLSGVVQNAGDAQTINASSVQVQGTNVGTNNGIFIRAASGDQTLTVTGDISIAAGAGGEAWIQGSRDGLQKIYAHNITMKNAGADDLTSPAGTNSFAALQGGHQEIHASGDVLLKAGRTAGTGGGVRMGGLRNPLDVTATDLKLYVTGNLSLQGGTGADNGASIGTSGSVALPNAIYIEAGSVALNAGSGNGAGVRIGSGSNAVAGGNIEVHAAGAIELNGPVQSAAFRTQGNVWLDAASINQVSNGFVAADKLTVTTAGAANLAGPNQINRFDAASGGALTLRDAGSLQVLGITTTNAPITLTTDSLINSGVIANGGDPSALVILNANAFNLAGGEIQAGAAAVAVRPRDPTNLFGIESAGQTTLSNADIDKIYTDNFIILGSGQGSFTGSMIIGQNARVEGAGKNLAFFRTGAGTTAIGSEGVRTTGDLIISSNGGSIVSNGGVVAGDEVQLRATLGIGAAGAWVKTDANALTIVNSTFGVPPFVGGNAFVSEVNDVTLRSTALSVGGMVNNANNFISGSLDFAAAGNATVAGTVQSIGPMNVTTGGTLTLAASGVQDAILRADNGGQTINAQSVNINARDGRLAQIVNFGANQTVTASSIDIRTLGSGTAELRNSTVGEQTINVAGGSITLRGADSGVGRASIFSGGNQTINGNPSLLLTGGGSGVAGAGNDARIETALGTARQTIHAGSIVLEGSALANSGTVSGLFSSHQAITATGDVIMNSGLGAHPGNVRIQGGNGPTDLQLNVGGSLILTGGNAAGGGVGLGSSAGSNNITINATGDVILNSGVNGARIGSSSDGTMGGDISISARNIALNGIGGFAGIRTLDSVTLSADQPGGTIGQSGNGRVIANSLTASSYGDTSLIGPNEVANFNGSSTTGDVTLNNVVAINVTGLNASNAALTNAGDVSVIGPWNSVTTAITTTGAGSDLAVNSAVTSSGAMTLNISGALNVNNALLSSIGGQTITAQSVSVTAEGGGFAQILNRNFGQQAITAGTVDVQTLAGGGTAEIRNNSAGAQTLTVTGDHLNVHGLGGGSALVIAAGGSQTIDMTGVPGKRITLGSEQALGGSSLRGGNQLITGNADILMTGGAGPVQDGSNALIIAFNPGATQIIEAGALTLANSSIGGNNSVAAINGANQTITTTGDVRMTANASGGSLPGVRIGGLGGGGGAATATNLTLNVGGDLVLTGGTLANNGVGIGSTATADAPPLANNITINAPNGNVILNSGVAGSGVRIGAPATPGGVQSGGNIVIAAGGEIRLNGVDEFASIRTRDSVTLSAASITEAAQGRIIAGSLSTTTSGDTLLSGPNQLAAFNATSGGGDVTLNNSGVLDVTGMSAFGDATITNVGTVTVSGPWTAGGTSTITVGSDIVLQSAMQSRDVVLVSTTGAIDQAAGASITAETLTTSSLADTVLAGTNAVETVNASSTAGNIRLNIASDVLKLHNMSLPGALVVNNAGAIEVSGEVSALSHDLGATGNVTVGGANASGATLLYAPGFITISTPGSILVHGSDTLAGAGSAVIAGGTLTFNAGDVSIRGGAGFATPSAVRGSMVNLAAQKLQVTGGSGHLSPAVLSSGSNFNLQIGDSVHVTAGSGLLSLARIQTEIRDGVINVSFPDLAGSYFVNGVEGHEHHGQTGFFTGFKAAKEGRSLLLTYGD